ncbi:solute:sodium symporter family transporter [Saccharibacillus kuerlensis]|nr:solute:sodium symporter family transporter [Saccharibacillus kuerlensis]
MYKEEFYVEVVRLEVSNIWFTLLSCLFFMGLVAYISYRLTKGEVNSSEGYFLAGRGLSGTFIAGSLLLTNLSAEQLIGLNGQGYRANLSNMAWEVTAGVAVIVLALYLLPKYLGAGISTIPEFLSKRYDDGVRRLTVLLFMFGYILVTIPSTLYSGALAVMQLFDIPSLFGISYGQSLWLIVWIIGIIGAIYAIFGGLRAVAVSDTLNGIGLLIIGILVPILGFIALGDGSILQGMKTIATQAPEKLNAIGSSTDSVPFAAIFTGILFANLFYWSSNQYVIQRTLGAKNLAEGQKGALLSGYFKLLIPFFMMIPGVIAFHLYGGNLASVDLAYPTLVANELPIYLSGFFLAVLLGAVFSSFNSLLNSAATMFTLDVYKPLFAPNADDRKLIRISKIFGTIVAVVSMAISPLLVNAPDGLWDLIRKFTGFFNIPIIVILLMGIWTKKVPPMAAKVVIIFHVIAYYMLVWGTDQLFGLDLGLNFVYVYGIMFFVEAGIMLVIGRVGKSRESYRIPYRPRGDMTPWKYAIMSSILLFSAIIGMYILFSPIGLAYSDGIVSPWFLPAITALIVLAVLISLWSIRKWNGRYAHYLNRTPDQAENHTP